MLATVRHKRQQRVKKKVRRSVGKDRLCVYRSNRYIYAQLIDGVKGDTIASASSLEAPIKEKHKGVVNLKVSAEVGKLIAERAIALGRKEVVFDRNGFVYHGKVKELADAARAAGLQF